MKYTTIKILGILGLASTLSLADVPHIFVPNTPAKASDVNANFKALSDKIVTIEQDMSNGGGSDNGPGDTVNENCRGSPFDYTYSYHISQIGDEITIAGKKYKIVAMPFVEFGTGDHYYIKYPVEINTYGTYVSTSAAVTTTYLKTGTSCYKDVLSGQKANIDISYSRIYSASMGSSDSTSSGNFIIKNNAGIYANVKINQTQISIYFWDNVNDLQNTLITSGDFDMRDNINWDAVNADTTMVNNLKKMMDYVQIIKI